MFSGIIRCAGESVTVVRLSADKDEEMIIASEIMCLIQPVKGQYEHWKAQLEMANRRIIKGDILRRDNGSELEVLRSVTQSGAGLGELTALNFKRL